MALVDLAAVHEPHTLVPVEIVAADGVEGRLALLYFDLLPAWEAAEAVAIRHHHGAAHLDELGELRVVDLAARQRHTGAEREHRLRTPRLQLRQRILQIGQDQVVGTDLAHQHDHMVLVPGDGRVFQLPEIADSRDDPAEAIVALYRLPQRRIGHVHAVVVAERVQHLQLQLGLVVVQTGPVTLHGRVDDGGEEPVVLHWVQQGEMLLHPLHGGAALRPEQRVEIVEAALDGPLQNAAHIGTVPVGHVVRRDLRRAAVGRPQPGGKAALQVQQHLRDVVAVVSQRQLPLVGGLLYQCVVGLLQQILEKDHVLQVFHGQNSFLQGRSLIFGGLSLLDARYGIFYHFFANAATTLPYFLLIFARKR